LSSEETGKGWLAASDTTAIYTPLHRVAGEEGAAAILDALKQSISKSKELGELTPLQEKQYEIQLDWLSKNSVPNLETIVFSKALAMPEQGRSYFAMLVGNQHPFSRGSIVSGKLIKCIGHGILTSYSILQAKIH